MARTSWTPQQLGAYQRRRLTALLQHAVTASPYYQRVLGPDAAEAPLEQLPTLPKATLMEHFDEIVTDPRLRRSELETHLAGPHATQPWDSYLVLTTSGSTGLRGIFVYSPEELASGVAALLRAMAVFGVTPEARLVGIGAPSARHISRHLVAGLMAGRVSPAPRLFATTPVRELVEALNAYQPEVVPTNAGIAALLAEEQLAGRLHISPRIVIGTSEVLTADMRARIRDAWGVEPHEFYATTETGVLASTSPHQAGLHIWEDLVVVEVVDSANRPVPAGQPGHKLLVTSLVNRVQPLIRYELSDSVTLAEGNDPAGMPFRRLATIGGRTDDILDLPGTLGGTVRVHPHHLRAPFARFPDVVQYQIVHDDKRLSVLMVLRPGADVDTPQQVAGALTASLHAAGAVAPPVTAIPVDHIDNDGGIAGKFPVIRSAKRLHQRV